MSLDQESLYARWRGWMNRVWADVPSLTFMITSHKSQDYGIWIGGHFPGPPHRHVNDNRRRRPITKET